MNTSTGRLWFLAKFVLAAGALFGLWSAAGGADVYAYAVLVAVTVLSPALTGYEVAVTAGNQGISALFEAGTSRVEVPFILREALAGVIPFLALMIATPGQALRVWARRTAAGLGGLYVAHVAVLVMSPLLVTPHARWMNRVIDVTYGFYAVAGFVGLPFSLWLVLARPWAMEPRAAAGERRVARSPKKR